MGGLNTDDIDTFVALGGTFTGGDADDASWPHLWTVPPSAVTPEDKPIRIPSYVESVTIESEPAVVIDGPLFNATETEAEEAIRGLTVSNDLTAGGDSPGHPYKEGTDNPYARHRIARGRGHKLLPSFQPVKTSVKEVSCNELQESSISASVDGNTVIEGSMNEMIWSVPELIAHTSKVVKLDGTSVISLGAPSGSRPIIDSAETVTCSVAGLGTLKNSVQRTD